jgi:hypothetical protein
VVAAPNEWQKSARRAGHAAKANGAKSTLYATFWPKLIARLNADRPDWTRRRPDGTRFTNNWLDMPCGVAGARYSLSFSRGGRLRHEIYIDSGDAETNLNVFRALEDQRDALIEAYGRPLEFEELPGRTACRVADYSEGTVENDAQHTTYIEWLVDSGDRFRRALEAIDVP